MVGIWVQNKAWKGIKGVLGNLEAAVLNRGSGGTSLNLSLGTDIQERKGEPRSYCEKEKLGWKKAQGNCL